MASMFPSVEWLDELKDYLNQDEQYAEVAKKWEGDLLFDIEPEGALEETLRFYLDLWHGKCREAYILEQGTNREAAFVLAASYSNVVKIVKGELDPMQAMLTRKLKVQGSMAYMMRNVPVVLDFVRCVQDCTDKVFGE